MPGVVERASKMKYIFLVIVLFTISINVVTSTPFTIGRIKYDGGGDWYTDPSALVNWLAEARRVLLLETDEKDSVVDLHTTAFFIHPLLFISGHGNVVLSAIEVKNLREYLIRGGTLYANDDYGFNKAFRREMKKVFPELEFREITFDHPIYRCYFEMEYLPKVHKHDGKPPQLLALIYEGRVVVWYTHEADIMDGLVDEEIFNDSPKDRAEAMKFALNLLVYILSR